MPKREREKGLEFQRVIAQRLRVYFGDQVRSGSQYRKGTDACDVEGTPWWIECKRGKSPQLRGALKQAEEATDGRPILAITHEDQEKPGQGAKEWVAMSWETFRSLLAPQQ